METTVNEPKGITMHTETLRMCVVDLSKEEKGGVLESILHDYFPDEFHEDTDRTVRVVTNILRDNISRNQTKYATRKTKNAEYWEKYNRERKQRERNKILQELQGLQGVTIAPEVLQELSNVGLDNKSNVALDNKSKSKPNTKSNTKPNTNTKTNDVEINTSNSNNNENIKNNSLSNENKYTLDEVREILERERIFFKNNWLRDFFRLNSAHYKWKFDPVSAAQAFIRLHPEAEKKQENAPQVSAAPPTESSKAAYSEMEAKDYHIACEWWNEIYHEISPKMTKDGKAFIERYMCPDAGYVEGFSTKVLRFTLDNSNEDFKQLISRADALIVEPNKPVFQRYVEKVKYRPKIPLDAIGG